MCASFVCRGIRFENFRADRHRRPSLSGSGGFGRWNAKLSANKNAKRRLGAGPLRFVRMILPPNADTLEVLYYQGTTDSFRHSGPAVAIVLPPYFVYCIWMTKGSAVCRNPGTGGRVLFYFFVVLPVIDTFQFSLCYSGFGLVPRSNDRYPSSCSF